ncbi:MAG: ATP-binding cassette domain-containing protein, partial [Bacteroidales bacterium]
TVDAKIGYGSKVIIDNVNVTIERGEKIAFVGRNGEGKTTLMRVIQSELEPIAGEATVGFNVEIGYFAQNQEDILDKNATVFDTLDKIAVGDIRTKLRDILAAFLFKGEDIDKKVSVLSGGERARLAMAKLMLKPHNLLALDEPTNHMDLLSKDILKQALQNYDGTIIIVSHDRDFLEGLVDKVYEFSNGMVKEHLGGITNFLENKRLDNLKEIERKATPTFSVAVNAVQISDNQLSYQQMKEIEKEKRKAKLKLENCEKRIEELEQETKAIEEKLLVINNVLELEKLSAKYKGLKDELDAKMNEWTNL